MTLRIRFGKGRLVKRHREAHGDLMHATASLLPPVCVMAYVLAFWRLAADLGLVADSGLQGVFSHWQVWITIAAGLQLYSRSLNRKLQVSHAQLGHKVTDRVE